MRRDHAPAGMHRRKLRPAAAVCLSWSWTYALMACAAVLVLDFGLAFVLPRHALRIGLGSLCLDAAMLIALVGLYRSRPFALSDLGLRPTAGARAVGLTFLALIVYVVIATIWGLAVLGLHRHQVTPQLPAAAAGRIVAGFALCLIAPTIEELFFRGFLYRALRNRLNVTSSVLIVAALFAAAHASTYPAETLPIKALFAIVTCLLYERTGSLYPGIALHSLIDSAGYEGSISHGEIWLAPLPFLALGLVVLIRHRFRAPSQNELATVGLRSRQASNVTDTGGGLIDVLAVRVGYHSPRRLLGILGGLLIAGGFITSIIGVLGPPTARHDHPTARAVLGLILILGLLMIATALIWRLVRRPLRS